MGGRLRALKSLAVVTSAPTSTPDRTTIKSTIVVTPGHDHPSMNMQTRIGSFIGRSETVANLIPYLLRSFLDGDRSFAKTGGRA
jgi:hypothetical protein